jgi:mRNA-degrading endonuclease RelE of RelBE toxin-antitoxin system
MAYKVVVEKTAAKTIGKMDARPRKIILNFLKELAQSSMSNRVQYFPLISVQFFPLCRVAVADFYAA